MQGTETGTGGEAKSLRSILLDVTTQQEDGLNGHLCCRSYIPIVSAIFMHFVTSLQWNTTAEKMCAGASVS